MFDVEKQTIDYHINEIYITGELEPKTTTKNFMVVQTEGNRQVKRELEHYNLDMIISIGYRVNSLKVSKFYLTFHEKKSIIKKIEYKP